MNLPPFVLCFILLSMRKTLEFYYFARPNMWSLFFVLHTVSSQYSPLETDWQPFRLVFNLSSNKTYLYFFMKSDVVVPLNTQYSKNHTFYLIIFFIYSAVRHKIIQ